MIQRIAIFFSVMCVISQVSATLHRPDNCPGLYPLKTHRFTDAYYSQKNHEYQPYTINDYGTDEEWFFVVFVDSAPSAEKAIKLANRYLPTLYGKPVPISDGHGGYTCLYMTDYGFAYANTPASRPLNFTT